MSKLSLLIFTFIASICLASASRAAVITSRQDGCFLAGGHGFSLYLSGTGRVTATGANNLSQLGDGVSGGFTTVPVTVKNLDNAKSIGSGDSFGLALRADGTVAYWGSGLAALPTANCATAVPGAVGVRAMSSNGHHAMFVYSDGSVSRLDGTSTSPVPVGSFTNAVGTVSGDGWDIIYTSDGKAYSFGSESSHGELGLGDTSPRTTPTLITGLPPVLTMSGSGHHVMALTGSGLYEWGKASSLGIGATSDALSPVAVSMTHIRGIKAVGENSFVIGSLGTTFGAGPNYGGSLGLAVAGPVNTFMPLTLSPISAVGGDDRHSLFEFSLEGIMAGAIASCGDNTTGCLGLANTTSVNTPMLSVIGDQATTLMVAAGDGGTLVLGADHKLHYSGKNDHGQAGIGSEGADILTDVPVPGLCDIVWISMGGETCSAVDKWGHLFSWGRSDYGQTAVSTSDVLSPTQVTAMTGVVETANGFDHILALKNDQTTWGVGHNNHYQLGLGDTTDRHSFTQITGLTGTPLAIGAGGDHSGVLMTTGIPYFFGSGGAGECGIGSTADVQTPTAPTGISGIVAMALGDHHTQLLNGAGSQLFAGANSHGQLMDGTTTSQVSFETLAPVGANLIWAGHDTSFYADYYNLIWAAGAGTAGQLGNGGNSDTSTPSFPGYLASIFAAGKLHSVGAYLSSVMASGDGTHGALDSGTTYSTTWPQFTNFWSPTINVYTSLSGGLRNSLAADEQGNFLGWGDNSRLQYSPDGITYLSPYSLGALNLLNVNSGFEHSSLVDIWADSIMAGANSKGALGDGTNTTSQALEYSGLVGVLATACGHGDTYWILDDHSLVASGDNQYGQIGDGTLVDKNSPVTVLTGVRAVFAGDGWVMAFMLDGSIKTWGRSQLYQTGQNSTANVLTPTTLAGITNPLAGAAGATCGYVVLSNGTLVDWGTATWGLGLGLTTQASTPTQVLMPDGITPIGNIIGVVAGNGFATLQKVNGTALQTGDDSFNIFGDGNYTSQMYFQPLTLADPLNYFAAGQQTLLMQLADGSNLFYGNNQFGALGNGSANPPPPQAPISLSGTLVGTNEIDLTWVPQGSFNANYGIYQSTDNGQTWTYLTTVSGTATSYNVTGLNAGTFYQFQINALNASGASGWVKTAPTPTAWVAPTAPTSVTAVAGSDPGTILISWNNAGSDPQSMEIDREFSGGSFVPVVTFTVPPLRTSYVLANIFNAPPARYTVTSINPLGTATSAETDLVKALPLPRYSIIDLGVDFLPVHIGNNLVIAGTDWDDQHLVRWNGTSLSALTASLSNVVGTVAENNLGDVVSTVQVDGNTTEALYWPAGNNDAAPVINSNITTTASWSFHSYNAIDDNDAIFGSQLTCALGYQLTGTGGTPVAYGSPIVPGQTGPPGTPGSSPPYSPSTQINYYYNYDGFKNTTELGTAPTIGGGNWNTVTRYPVLASKSLVVTQDFTGVANNAGTWVGFSPSGVLTAHAVVSGTLVSPGTTLPAGLAPISVNNLGQVAGQTYSAGVPSSIQIWSPGEAVTTLSHPTPGEKLVGINSRATTGSTPVPDIQILSVMPTGDSVLWEHPHGTSGNPTGNFFPTPLQDLIPGDSPWIVDAYAINDKGTIVAEGNDDFLSFGTVLMLPTQFITPGGDPRYTPVDAGTNPSSIPDGANQFTFSADATGTLTIALKVNVGNIGDLDPTLKSKFFFSVDAIGSSTLTWATANPGGQATITGDVATATVTFSGLPAHNSDFGLKTATLLYNGDPVFSQKYMVLFPRDATNHPAISGIAAGTPNWFVYWKDGNVCGMGDNCVFDPDPSVYAYTLPSLTDQTIRLGANAANHNVGSVTFTDGSGHYLTVGGDGKGIQGLAEMLTHESHHLAIFNQWHITVANPTPDDTDGDAIPGQAESSFDGISTSPTNADTYNVASYDESYSTYGDNELRCRYIEHQPLSIAIHPELDWANPGCQSQTQNGPLVTH